MSRARPWLGFLLGAAVLVVGCSGSDSSDSSAQEATGSTEFASLSEAVQLQAATEKSVKDLAEADSPADAKEARKDLQAIGRQADALVKGDGEEQPSIDTRRALLKLQIASAKLVDLAIDMENLYREAAIERTPGEEAQNDVVDLSQRMTKLKDQLKEPSKAMRGSALATSQALRAIAPDLDADQTTELATLKVQVASAKRVSGLDGISDALDTQAGALADQVASLEPPDVIEDCTSQYEPNVADMSVRNMSCAEADALTSDVIQALAPSFSVDGYSCSILGDIGEYDGVILGASDIRCESGDQAFRFSFGD